MTPLEAKKLLQSAMMGEHTLTEVEYASLINTINGLQQEILEIKADLQESQNHTTFLLLENKE